jgi:hypothetical protein
VIETLEHELSDGEFGVTVLDEPTDPRRWVRIVGVGTAVIAGLATLLARSQPAGAWHECLGQPHCCELATCTLCDYNVSHDRFYCPSGYFRYTWMCTEPDGSFWWCGECTGSQINCFNGPFACSQWFAN